MRFDTSILCSAVFAFAPVVTAAAAEPFPLGPLGGSVHSIAVNPLNALEILHLIDGVGAGLYRSLDGGKSLAPYGTGLSPQALALTKHPLNGQQLYALAGKSISVSIDFGATWNSLSLVATDNLYSLAIDSTGNGMLAQSYAGIHHSPDGGASWTNLALGFVTTSVAYAPSNPQIAFFGDLNGLWKSTDGGASFTKHGTFTQWAQAIAVAPSNPNIVFIGGQSGVHRSVNGGQSFTQIASDGNSEFFTFSPAGRLWNVMLGELAYSDDLGNTWISALDGLPPDPIPLIHQIDFDSAGSTYLGTRGGGLNDSAGGGLYRWFDATSQWEHLGHLASHVRSVAIAGPGGKRVIGMGAGVYAGDAGSELLPTVWHYDFGTDTRALVVDPANPDRWVTGGVGSFLDNAQVVVVSAAGSVFTKTYEVSGGGRVDALAFDPFNPTRALAGIYPGGFGLASILRSTNSGQSWTPVAGTPGWTTRAIAFDPFVAGRVIQLSETNQWSRSLNGGQTWVPLQPAWPGSGAAMLLAFDPFKPGVVYRGETGSGLWRSDDNTTSWIPLGVPLHDDSDLVLHPQIPGMLFVSDAAGRILISGDRGNSFTVALTVPQQKSATGLALDTANGALLFGTTGVSAWELPEASPYVVLEGGTAGSGGHHPRHFGIGGLPEVGNGTFGFGGDRIAGGAPFVLFVGFSEIAAPLMSGTFFAGPPLITLFLTASGSAGTPGAGAFALPVGIPNDPAVAGIRVISQFAVIDGGAPQQPGVALSDGLRTTILP